MHYPKLHYSKKEAWNPACEENSRLAHFISNHIIKSYSFNCRIYFLRLAENFQAVQKKLFFLKLAFFQIDDSLILPATLKYKKRGNRYFTESLSVSVEQFRNPYPSYCFSRFQVEKSDVWMVSDTKVFNSSQWFLTILSWMILLSYFFVTW